MNKRVHFAGNAGNYLMTETIPWYDKNVNHFIAMTLRT